jgi:hypothetical protein
MTIFVGHGLAGLAIKKTRPIKPKKKPLTKHPPQSGFLGFIGFF